MRPLAIVVLFLAGSAGGGNTGQEPLPQGGRWSDEHLWYGKAIAGVGDVDGDGCGDFAVSAPYARWSTDPLSGGGIVRLHSGRTGRILWESRGFLGETLVCVQDANEDGTPDLALDVEAGKAIVLSGCTGEQIRLSRRQAGLARPTRGTAGTAAPWLDVNGDGVGDPSIAALLAASAVFREHPALGRAILLTADGPLVRGAEEVTAFKVSLLVADLDGNSSPEIVLQSLFWMSDPERSELHLAAMPLTGGPELWATELFTCHGAWAYACRMADADADQVEDIAVGLTCPDGAHAGAVWIFSGRTGAPIHQVTVAMPSSLLGNSLAPAGDLDGDGFGDLLVTQYEGLFRDGSVTRGRVYLVSGLSGSVLWSSAEPQAGSREPWEDFGASVAGIGDIDGDDLPDLAVGAMNDGTGAFWPGAVHVYSGASGRWIYSLP